MMLDLFSAKDKQKGFTHRARRSRAKVKKRALFSSLGFTLMELLVVIAIFGLIASIVFVISRSALDNARISRSLQFSQHLQNSLGAYLVGRWSFDEGTGTTANDTSGWDNHGTIYGANWRCASTDPNYTPSEQGCSLQFDGENDYVQCGNITLGEYTFEFWLKAFPDTNFRGILGFPINGFGLASSVSHASRSLLLLANSNYQYFDSGSYLDGNWHHWVLYVAGSGQYDIDNASLTIDGNVINKSNKYNTEVPSAWSSLRIGYSSYYYLLGILDEVRIYATSLTSVQIESQYYAGLERLLTKGQINEKEYQQRTGYLSNAVKS
jgi:prepilin-type N-terminal cleavage/methylation domain-containing protein